MKEQFWKKKSLAEFSEEEWESVCMRCGKCCVTKMSDKNNMLFYTQVCDGLDFSTGLCKRYATRLCRNCLKVDMDVIKNQRELLPDTCAYRLLYEGKDLPPWHPLITGNLNSVRDAKQTILDVEGAYSQADLSHAHHELSIRSHQENWDVERFMRENDKIMEKYPLKVFACCPIPKT